MKDHQRFDERRDSGIGLGSAPCERGTEAGTAPAISWGGLPAGLDALPRWLLVADAPDAPLDLVTRTTGASDGPEDPKAAISSGGKKTGHARRAARRDCGGRPEPDQAGRNMVVDDEVNVLEMPEEFRGVGQFYERFDQVSAAEAMTYLEPA